MYQIFSANIQYSVHYIRPNEGQVIQHWPKVQLNNVHPKVGTVDSTITNYSAVQGELTKDQQIQTKKKFNTNHTNVAQYITLV